MKTKEEGDVMYWKKKVYDIVAKLRVDSSESEKHNQRTLEGCEKDKDKQYWNGYHDALENVKNAVKSWKSLGKGSKKQ